MRMYEIVKSRSPTKRGDDDVGREYTTPIYDLRARARRTRGRPIGPPKVSFCFCFRTSRGIWLDNVRANGVREIRPVPRVVLDSPEFFTFLFFGPARFPRYGRLPAIARPLRS